MHKVKTTYVRTTVCCLVVYGLDSFQTVFLYLSGFSTEYISRPDICAVSHALELFKQNELMINEFVLYQVRTTTLPLFLWGAQCSLYYITSIFKYIWQRGIYKSVYIFDQVLKPDARCTN